VSKPKPTRPANIIEAVSSADWWGPWFPKPESWAAWRAFWKATFCIPMDAEDLHIFQTCTGRQAPPAELPKEIAEIIGRRGGKTRGAATTAAWLAVFVDWRPYLAPGEKAMILLIAADRRQARVALRYIRSLILDHPELKKLVVGETQESIELRNRVVIEVTTASFRTIRGYSIAALIADEIAYWFDGEASANPAEEILAAARPAMATMGPNALLLKMSSPHARRGPLWEDRKRFYGKEDAPTLVWQASTKVMNPSVPQRIIDEAYEQDPARASAEFGAEFRTDVETFVSREVVDAAVVDGRYELPPVQGIRYRGFTDPSGGSSDSMTLCICHRDKDGTAIVDAIRERRPPFSPDSVVKDFSEVLKSYWLSEVVGDRYAGEWVREPFKTHGIKYLLSEQPKSDIYRDLLPMLNSGKVELLDVPRLISQLCSLERRTARGGRDSIDHPPGGAHDDVANAVAGAIVHLGSLRRPMVFSAELLAKSRLPGPPRTSTFRQQRALGR
jgi:hypothetical protein